MEVPGGTNQGLGNYGFCLKSQVIVPLIFWKIFNVIVFEVGRKLLLIFYAFRVFYGTNADAMFYYVILFEFGFRIESDAHYFFWLINRFGEDCW